MAPTSTSAVPALLFQPNGSASDVSAEEIPPLAFETEDEIRAVLERLRDDLKVRVQKKVAAEQQGKSKGKGKEVDAGQKAKVDELVLKVRFFSRFTRERRAATRFSRAKRVEQVQKVVERFSMVLEEALTPSLPLPLPFLVSTRSLPAAILHQTRIHRPLQLYHRRPLVVSLPEEEEDRRFVPPFFSIAPFPPFLIAFADRTRKDPTIRRRPASTGA